MCVQYIPHNSGLGGYSAIAPKIKLKLKKMLMHGKYMQPKCIQDFSEGRDYCNCKEGGMTIHCLITKICELGACFPMC